MSRGLSAGWQPGDPFVPQIGNLARRFRGALSTAVLVILVGVCLGLRAAGAWPISASSDSMHQFLLNTLDGFTAGAVYFLVASGFTLIFGLMRVVNLAHGSFYLLGGYLAWSVSDATGSWVLGILGGAVIIALIGLVVQQDLLRPLQNDVFSRRGGLMVVAVTALLTFVALSRWGHMTTISAGISALLLGTVVVGFFGTQASLRTTQNRDLREALITIGFSIIAADLMLAHYGGLSYTLTAPDRINGAANLGWLSTTVNRASGLNMTDLIYPQFRIVVLGVAAAVFILLWSMLNLSRLGMIVRAAIDDRGMVSALGINIQIVFAVLFTLGAALAGLAGGMEGTLTSLTTSDDGTFLLWSLIVVIIGGMGSLGGAALGAVLVGLVEQYGLAYSPTNAETIIFLIMVLVLAVRPQGLLGRPA